MSITDELRQWIRDGKGSLLAIADRIDAEYQKTIRELNNLADASVLLPVDADGEPIRAGDKVVWKNETFPRIVQSMTIYPEGLWTIIASGVRVDREKLRHYHAPTVEDVLREFWSDVDLAVADCGDPSSIIAEYAAKLREVMAE